MPILMKMAVKKGWKAQENARFGNCIVVQFLDLKSKRVLFEYAPKLGDQDFWNLVFKTLESYNQELAEVMAMENKINDSQAEGLDHDQVKCK